MDTLLIIGAKYLIYLSPVIVAMYLLKLPSEARRQIIIFFLISLPLTYLAGVLARELYFNPRPFVVGGFESLIPHAADNGFPSDHVLLAGALAAGMLFFNRKLSAWLWSMAAVVALSRTYAGVHHTIDVISSAALALVIAVIVHAIIRQWQKTNF